MSYSKLRDVAVVFNVCSPQVFKQSERKLLDLHIDSKYAGLVESIRVTCRYDNHDRNDWPRNIEQRKSSFYGSLTGLFERGPEHLKSFQAIE